MQTVREWSDNMVKSFYVDLCGDEMREGEIGDCDSEREETDVESDTIAKLRY